MNEHLNFCITWFRPNKNCDCGFSEIQKLQYRIKYLETAISKLAIPHRVCEDDYYSCACVEDFGDGSRKNDKECTCGADDHNKFIAEVLK